jgi:hypothetical protein
MQETELTRDALLAKDADYVRGAVSRVYYAYPSARLPQWLVPEGDQAGLRFALRTLSSGWGTVGALVRLFLRIPGVPFVCRALLFERTRI